MKHIILILLCCSILYSAAFAEKLDLEQFRKVSYRDSVEISRLADELKKYDLSISDELFNDILTGNDTIKYFVYPKILMHAFDFNDLFEFFSNSDKYSEEFKSIITSTLMIEHSVFRMLNLSISTNYEDFCYKYDIGILPYLIKASGINFDIRKYQILHDDYYFSSIPKINLWLISEEIVDKNNEYKEKYPNDTPNHLLKWWNENKEKFQWYAEHCMYFSKEPEE